MASVNGKAEAEIVGLNRTDSNVILLIGDTIVTYHYTFNIS